MFSFLSNVSTLLYLRQSLNSVSKHSAGHIEVMCIKITNKFRLIAFAGLAQEPTYSLMDKVVWMLKQQVGNVVGVMCFAVSKKLHSRNNRDALFP